MSGLLRVYLDDELGPDGYPPEWHAEIKHLIRAEAGHRCERCRHPYRNGEHGSGEWSPCDRGICTHLGEVRLDGGPPGKRSMLSSGDVSAAALVEARWRILTVHHLTGGKADCRWWNLAALCQRCHLTIQGRVIMERPYPGGHSEWFRPHAAGWYAWRYLGLELAQVEEEVEKAQEEIALRCAELGIPREMAPSLQLSWAGNGRYVLLQQQGDLRRAAYKQIEAMERTAKHEIDHKTLEIQTSLVASGLTSDEAVEFLKGMPSVDALMPRLEIAALTAGTGRPDVDGEAF